MTLIRLSSMEVLDQLAEIDLLPKALANRAAETITDEGGIRPKKQHRINRQIRDDITRL